jgi:hypothetical protein
MKVCLVLMGPIAGSDRNYGDGEEITLEDGTAKYFDMCGYVEILRDADDGSIASGKVAPAEAVTSEPVAEVAPATTTRKRATTSTAVEELTA